uniref:Uncharacterized protein n=1 Tax=Strigamia maritima TaxID=126957 RepID=T1IJK7_STRMM
MPLLKRRQRERDVAFALYEKAKKAIGRAKDHCSLMMRRANAAGAVLKNEKKQRKDFRLQLVELMKQKDKADAVVTREFSVTIGDWTEQKAKVTAKKWRKRPRGEQRRK